MKTKTLIGCPDFHYPHYSRSAVKAVLSFCKDIRPDILIFMGDSLDFDIISHWNIDDLKSREGKRIKTMYDGFDKDILTPFENASKWSEKVYLWGNHEVWIEQFVSRIPQIEGLVEFENCLNLNKRKWRMITENNHYQIGKLSIIHGFYSNVYHSRKHLDAWGEGSCLAYGHSHTIQQHTIVYRGGDGLPRMAMSCGCLSTKNPHFMRNRPNSWVNAFLYAEIRDDGIFTAFVIPIINGIFSFNKKTYGL